MTISQEVEAEIRRLAHAEGWPRGTIATQLGVHHEVVERVLDADTVTPKERPPRASKLDPYKPFLLRKLDEHPTLRATRLHTMLKKRGFPGSVKIVRRYVATVRPRARSAAYLECERLPGEQAQIDWGKVGVLAVPGGERALWVFLMTLAYSRYRYAELVFELGVESLRRSLWRAVTFFGGTPREWLFDNTKAVVVERFGSAKRLQKDLHEFASAFHVMPRLCAPRRPEHKGGVERGIRDLKEGHFAGEKVRSIESGNRDLLAYIDEVVCARRHPRQPTRTVREVWEEERQRLLPLPTHMPSADLVTPVAVDKLANIHLATNRYSVPSSYAGGTLTLFADDALVRLVDGRSEVARHARSWGKHQRIEDLSHRRALVEERAAANAAPVREQLFVDVPELRIIFERAVDRGRNVGAMTARIKTLRELYGIETLREATRVMCDHGTHDPGALSLLCEEARRRRNMPIPLPLPLPSGVVDRDVDSHDLASYDPDASEEAPS
ncbi:MAG: IS21 family transposase [Myxococcales bacterium]|nr:IS21 family transposase [Myxococcales bacterium]